MNPASIDIRDIMVSELGFEFGVDLFISSQPDTPMNCVTIFDVSTTPPDGTVDGNNVFLYESIMMWVRNSSYEAAYQQAQAIISEFHNKSKFTQNETYYLYMNLQSGPNTLAGSEAGGEQDYSEFSLNFNLLRKSGVASPSNFLTFAALVQALVAGTNVSISVDSVLEKITISSTGGMTSVDWGYIGGTITDQEDLILYIASQIPSVPTDVNELEDASGQKVPAGGTTGQVLAKTSDGDGDTEWKNVGGGGGFTKQTLTDAASISWNAANGNYATVTIAGDRTISNPTNIEVGQELILDITQGTGGSHTLTFDTYFTFAGGITPILSSAEGDTDSLRFLVVSTTEIRLTNANFDV